MEVDNLPPGLRPVLAGLQPGQVSQPLTVPGAVVLFYMRDTQGTLRPGAKEQLLDYMTLRLASTIWQMPSGVQVFCHVSFTHPHAGTGLEIHGTEGSIIARNVMTQRPGGTVDLHRGGQVEQISFAERNLYAHGIGMFRDAVAGQGRPAADGADGVRSLAVAQAMLEAGRTGQRITVDYGGI